MRQFATSHAWICSLFMTRLDIIRIVGAAIMIVGWSAGPAQPAAPLATQSAAPSCTPNGIETLFGRSSRVDVLVVGVLSEAAGLCINGLPLQADGATRVSVDGASATLGALSVGQVAVVAASWAGGVLKASRVAVVHEVIGQVTDIDVSRSELGVMGRRVLVRASAQHASRAFVLASLKLGDVVRVSGLPDHRGEIDGTRIEMALTSEASVAKGRLTLESERPAEVAGVRVRFADSVAASPDMHHKDVRVSGRWTGRELVVEEIAVDPLGPLLDRSGRASLQGYLGNDGSGIALAGLRIRLGPATRFEGGDRRNLRSDAPVTLTGSLHAGRRVEVEQLRVAAPRAASDRGILLPYDPSVTVPTTAR